MLPYQINHGVIGHRGACAYAPENTQSAFDKALVIGCNFIEFDVMLSADGEPFVIHDESLKRTTNGVGDVGLVDSAYLKTLDAGTWFSKQFPHEKIPHFSEILQWLNFADINANIEIKPYKGMAEKTAVVVLTCLNRHWPSSKQLPLISSFDEQVLTLCRTLSPEMPLGLLLDQWDNHWALKAEELACYSIHMNKNTLTATRAREIKSKGYALYAYTVNKKSQAKKLFSWGVDAVFSDYPDLLSL